MSEIGLLAILGAWSIAGYLVGSIPFGLLIGKMRGVDIRKHGSKNIGATNCGRVCGWPFGMAAFLLDAAKGFGPTLAAAELLPPIMDLREERTFCLILVIVGASPVAGHLFPLWLSFKGGKGVATALGVVLALPMLRWPALAAFGLWIVVTAATRYVSVGSTAAAAAFLGAYLWMEPGRAWSENLPATILVLGILAMVLVRHRSNYVRLARGTESKLWGNGSRDAPNARSGETTDRPRAGGPRE
jgi:acyl phosphate:glycerol-3-phosphate acyltransferase